MKIIYAFESLGISGVPTFYGLRIFLAGPTPRTQNVLSWRPEAISIFEELEFDGTLFVPESRSGEYRWSYDDQIAWEERALNAADCIMFWVPRSLPDMPGLTTNDEWGYWKTSGKVVWGNPPNAEKVSYQRYYAKTYEVLISDTLKDTINNAIELALEIRDIRRGKVKLGGYR